MGHDVKAPRDIEMSVVAETIQQGARRVLIAQALLLLISATVAMLLQGWFAAVSALFGGVVTLFGTGWMAYRVYRAGELTRDNPSGGAVALYGGVLIRFVFVITALAIGMGVLKLQPVFVLIGFAVTHLGYILTMPSVKPRQD
jgi:ATP synthase protein I